LADDLSKLIFVFPLPENSFLYARTFFKTMLREWINIDRLRLDKFLSLVRMMFEKSLFLLERRGWLEDEVNSFCNTLVEIPLNPEMRQIGAAGLGLHVSDIYLDTLKKCVKEKPIGDKILKMLSLLVDVISKTDEKVLVQRIYTFVFKALFRGTDVYRNLQRPFWEKLQSHILDIASSESSKNKKELYKMNTGALSLIRKN